MRKGEGCWEKQTDPTGASHWVFRPCPCLPPHLAVTHRMGSTSNCGSFLISTFCQDLLVLLLSDLSHHLYPCVFSDHMSLESSFSLAQSCIVPFSCSMSLSSPASRTPGSFQLHQLSAAFHLSRHPAARTVF